MHIYTEDEKAFLKEYTPGHSYAEIRKAFAERFDWEITCSQVKASIARYHLSTGRTGYFEKGYIPVNKGKKMSEAIYRKCEKTMFKKGHIPANTRPVGSERHDKDGYIMVKVKEPDIWRPKHRVVWEKAYGDIPDGFVVTFRDGDKNNTALDNLILMSMSVNLIMNRTGLNGYTDELKETAVKLAELKGVTNAKRRERRK